MSERGEPGEHDAVDEPGADTGAHDAGDLDSGDPDSSDLDTPDEGLLSQLALIDDQPLADRAVALAGEVCEGRLVAMLEGGYSLLHLPLANLAILEGLAGLPPSFEHDPVGVDASPELRDVERDAVAAAERAFLS